MRTSCIRLRPKSRIAVLYEDFLEICDGNMLAAMLLAILVYWTDVKIGKKDVNLWIWKSHQDFQEDLMFDKPGMKPPHRTTIKAALDLLKDKKFVEMRKNPKMPLDQTRQYLVNQKAVQKAIDALSPIVENTTMECRETDNATSSEQQCLSENQQCNAEKPTSNTSDYGTEITESVTTPVITEGTNGASAPAHAHAEHQELEERVEEAIEDVESRQAERASTNTEQPFPPAVPPSRRDDANRNRVGTGNQRDGSRASGRKAQDVPQANRKAEIKALYAELLGFEPVWNRDEADGLKTLAQSPIATDEAIAATYAKYKKDKFWGPQLTLKVIAKFLNATVGSSNARPIQKKLPTRPTPDEIDQTIFCTDPSWEIYQRPGDDAEWVLWQGEFLTMDEANDRGYNGGFGLYKQHTEYAEA